MTAHSLCSLSEAGSSDTFLLCVCLECLLISSKFSTASIASILAAAQPEQRLGLADKPTPSSPHRPEPVHEVASTSQAFATSNVQGLQPAQPASPSSMYLPMETDPPASQSQSNRTPHQPPVTAATSPAAGGDSTSFGRADTGQAAASSQSESAMAEASPKDSSGAASVAASSTGGGGGTKPFPSGFDRHIHVFTREAVAAAEASDRYCPCHPCMFLIFWKHPDD